MMLRDAIDHMNWLAEHGKNEKTFRYTTSYSYLAPYWNWHYQYWSIDRFYWYGFKTWLNSGLWNWENFKIDCDFFHSSPPFSNCFTYVWWSYGLFKSVKQRVVLDILRSWKDTDTCKGAWKNLTDCFLYGLYFTFYLWPLWSSWN